MQFVVINIFGIAREKFAISIVFITCTYLLNSVVPLRYISKQHHSFIWYCLYHSDHILPSPSLCLHFCLNISPQGVTWSFHISLSLRIPLQPMTSNRLLSFVGCGLYSSILFFLVQTSQAQFWSSPVSNVNNILRTHDLQYLSLAFVDENL